jgi:hypothetical protein
MAQPVYPHSPLDRTARSRPEFALNGHARTLMTDTLLANHEIPLQGKTQSQYGENRHCRTCRSFFCDWHIASCSAMPMSVAIRA